MTAFDFYCSHLKYPCAVQGYFPFYSYIVNSNNIKYHIVYKTTNLINGKWYIGKHSTSNLDDGYLGSSQHLKSAIKKYGKHNFKREIICFCDSEEEAYQKEAEFVTMEVVNDLNSYNKMPGGEGKQKRYTDEELKEHQREYQREYQQANKESIREYKQEWYQANKEHVLEYRQEYYKANKESIREKRREYKREWYKANKERIREYKREYQREYYQANKERMREYQREYAAKNKNL